MKKIELHLHLDGSLNVSFANKLIGHDVSNNMISNNDQNLGEYLEKFNLPIELLKKKENITDFCNCLVEDLKKDNVIYAEVRFCPYFHIGELNMEEVLLSVIEGFSNSDVKINLILCMMRNLSQDDNRKILKLAYKYLNKGVVAVDLAGDEAKYKTNTFKELFEEVNKYNIPFTIHAGEADSSESVRAAIEMGAKRIGHGVRSIEDNDVINQLIENNITLEICPKSNIDTHVFNSIKEHAVRELYKKNVLITINTDNRTVSNTNLEYEYSLLKNELHFTDDDLFNFNMNAINAAFISDDEKEELRKKLKN